MAQHEATPSERALARGLVAAQLALVGVLLGRGRRRPPDRRGRRAVGLTLVGAGSGLAAAGALALGPALTPSPLPARGARLHTGGPYRWLRHPIYAGLTVAAAGRALHAGTVRHALAAATLGGLLQAKARYEERWLHRRFTAYADYAARTRRWVPTRGRGRRCGS